MIERFRSKRMGWLWISLGAVLFSLSPTLAADSPKDLPVKGWVNLIELGSDSCLPCRMMAPILARLGKTYKGKAEVHQVDVWKNPDQVKRFHIRVIPTLIFYDSRGREVYRHEGFMSEREIVSQLTKMGVR